METHPRAHRNYLVLALVAGGMLLAGAFFLHAGASGFAEAATPKTPPDPPPTVRSHTCKGVEQVLVSDKFPNFVEPETFTLCQGANGGRHMVQWIKDKDAEFVTFEAEFNQTNTPFENGQYDFSFGPGRSSVPTSPAKDLSLSAGQTPVYFKYKITICYDKAKTICETQDPGGIIQP